MNTIIILTALRISLYTLVITTLITVIISLFHKGEWRDKSVAKLFPFDCYLSLGFIVSAIIQILGLSSFSAIAIVFIYIFAYVFLVADKFEQFLLKTFLKENK